MTSPDERYEVTFSIPVPLLYLPVSAYDSSSCSIYGTGQHWYTAIRSLYLSLQRSGLHHDARLSLSYTSLLASVFSLMHRQLIDGLQTVRCSRS